MECEQHFSINLIEKGKWYFMYFVSTHFFWAFKKFTRADNFCMRVLHTSTYLCGYYFHNIKKCKKIHFQQLMRDNLQPPTTRCTTRQLYTQVRKKPFSTTLAKKQCLRGEEIWQKYSPMLVFNFCFTVIVIYKMSNTYFAHCLG